MSGGEGRPIAVIGAGVAGLAAALALLRRGQGPVRVLDRRDFAGGLAATRDWQGCRVDFGPHRLLSHYPDVDELERQLLGDELVFSDRRSEILLPRGFVPYPGSPFAVARAMGYARGVAAVASYLMASAGRRRGTGAEAPSYESYLVGRFGRGLYRTVFETFPLKVWGLAGSEVDADAARIRLASKNLWETLRDLLAGSPKTLVTQVAYPRRGVGRLAERMVEEIERLGGTVELGQRVVGCRVAEDRIDSLHILDKNSRPYELPVRLVASSMPLAALARLVAVAGWRGAAADELAEAEALRTIDVRLVYVLLRKERMTQNHWLYFPGSDVFFTRTYEPKAFSPDTAPHGKTAVCVESSCYRDWISDSLSDGESAARVVGDLERSGLVRREDIEAVESIRLDEAYPVLRLGYRETLSRTLASVGRLDNCYSLGRQGLFSYNNMDLSVKMGLDLADAIERRKPPAQWYREAGERYGSYRIVD